MEKGTMPLAPWTLEPEGQTAFPFTAQAGFNRQE